MLSHSVYTSASVQNSPLTLHHIKPHFKFSQLGISTVMAHIFGKRRIGLGLLVSLHTEGRGCRILSAIQIAKQVYDYSVKVTI